MIFTKLNKSRNEEGFTLIELLIVIVIIGILAAIALPIFMNQQKSAIKATVKSDVRSVVDEISSHLVKEPTASNFSAVRMVISGDNKITTQGGWDGFVVKGTNDDVKDFDWCFNSLTGKSGEGSAFCELTGGNANEPEIPVGGGTDNPSDPGDGGGTPIGGGDTGSGTTEDECLNMEGFHWNYNTGECIELTDVTVDADSVARAASISVSSCLASLSSTAYDPEIWEGAQLVSPDGTINREGLMSCYVEAGFEYRDGFGGRYNWEQADGSSVLGWGVDDRFINLTDSSKAVTNTNPRFTTSLDAYSICIAAETNMYGTYVGGGSEIVYCNGEAQNIRGKYAPN